MKGIPDPEDIRRLVRQASDVDEADKESRQACQRERDDKAQVNARHDSPRGDENASGYRRNHDWHALQD